MPDLLIFILPRYATYNKIKFYIKSIVNKKYLNLDCTKKIWIIRNQLQPELHINISQAFIYC